LRCPGYSPHNSCKISRPSPPQLTRNIQTLPLLSSLLKDLPIPSIYFLIVIEITPLVSAYKLMHHPDLTLPPSITHHPCLQASRATQGLTHSSTPVIHPLFFSSFFGLSTVGASGLLLLLGVLYSLLAAYSCSAPAHPLRSALSFFIRSHSLSMAVPSVPFGLCYRLFSLPAVRSNTRKRCRIARSGMTPGTFINLPRFRSYHPSGFRTAFAVLSLPARDHVVAVSRCSVLNCSPGLRGPLKQ